MAQADLASGQPSLLFQDAVPVTGEADRKTGLSVSSRIRWRFDVQPAVADR